MDLVALIFALGGGGAVFQLRRVVSLPRHRRLGAAAARVDSHQHRLAQAAVAVFYAVINTLWLETALAWL